MVITYVESLEFVIENLTAAGDFIIAVGTINLKEENAEMAGYLYCDV